MGEYYLMHSGRSKRDGAKIGSGRYPLGSGDRPFQGEANKKLRKKNKNSDLGWYGTNTKKNEQNSNAPKTSISTTNAFTSTAQQVKNISEAAGRIEKRYRKEKKKPKPDFSNLTDEQMIKELNRYNLEKRYATMLSEDQPKIKTGREKVEDTLATVGDAAMIAGSIATTIGVIIALKNK